MSSRYDDDDYCPRGRWAAMAYRYLKKIGADTSRDNDIRDLAQLLRRVHRAGMRRR